MKNELFLSVALVASAHAFARPVVSNVSFVQADDGEVTVSYDLAGAPAIVTGDFLTNGVSVGAAHFTTLFGDVNRKIAVDGSHTFRWLPERDLPAVKIDEQSCRAEVTAWPESNPPEMIVINLCSNAAEHVSYYPSVDSLPGGVLSNTIYRTILLPLKKCRARGREFTFGTPVGVPDRHNSEAYRTVKFADDFYMGVFKVTQGQMNQVRGAKGLSGFSFVRGDLRACNFASLWEFREGKTPCGWGDGDEFSAYRYPHSPNPESFSGRVHGMTGLYLELPSDAEWHFMNLAGLEQGWMGHSVTNTTFDANMAKLGRCKHNGGWMNGAAPPNYCSPEYGIAPCGWYPPNPWGFYDCYGSVSELLLDEAVGYAKATSGQDATGAPYFNDAWTTDMANRRNLTAICGGSWNENCGHAQGTIGTGGVRSNNQHMGARICYRVNQVLKYAD